MSFPPTSSTQSITSNWDNLEVVIEALGNNSSLPKRVKEIVNNYFSNGEKSLISSLITRVYLPEFIDLRDPKVLKTYLCKELQGITSVSKFSELVKTKYEVIPRSIFGTMGKFGLSFGIYPEVLACAMKLAKDECVLEIAGSSGENAILLAAAGAERVFMNDITPQEVNAFNQLRNNSPQILKDRLVPIEGDCLDLLKIKPELKRQFGLIQCRNLIHFFSDSRQNEFFQLLGSLLKPGGRVLLTANSSHAYLEEKGVFEANPTCTSFATTQVLVYDFQSEEGSRGAPSSRVYNHVVPCAGNAIEKPFEKITIYERKLNHAWKAYKDEFQKLDPVLRAAVNRACKESQKTVISPIKEGRVSLLVTYSRYFSKKNLSDKFTEHGFETELPFAIDSEGHIMHSTDTGPYGTVGVIARYPGIGFHDNEGQSTIQTHP